ncbi:Homoserine O-succinyltransferase [Salmonella enterica subsp. enterica serovar Gallinarum/Pullorum str. FCAV198]|nr:Homoserine O-succinyltransferase [Salmonella enterica subsp. enterica serovar Gallinarum/Pullorum str. FCAV198]
MPIRVLDELPAVNFLREENVFVMKLVAHQVRKFAR